jgi:hypothetical protein
VRRGCRIGGKAEIVPRGSAAFDALLARLAPAPDLRDAVNAIVTIRVERAAPLISPAYDRGQTEDALRRQWTKRFRAQQPGGRFVENE